MPLLYTFALLLTPLGTHQKLSYTNSTSFWFQNLDTDFERGHISKTMENRGSDGFGLRSGASKVSCLKKMLAIGERYRLYIPQDRKWLAQTAKVRGAAESIRGNSVPIHIFGRQSQIGDYNSYIYVLRVAMYQEEPPPSCYCLCHGSVARSIHVLLISLVVPPVFCFNIARVLFRQEVDDANLLVAAIGVEEEELRSILGDVKGEPCGLDELGKRLGDQGGNWRDRWKKMYKITDEELVVSSLEDCVVMRMTVKDH